MNSDHERDWQKTRIHFVCGFVLGSISTFGSGGGWVLAVICGLLLGTLAGVFLDRFWERFQSWW